MLNNHNSELLGLEGYNFYTKNRQLRQHRRLDEYIRSDVPFKLRSEWPFGATPIATRATVYREMVYESPVLHLRLCVYSCYLIVMYHPPASSYNEFYDLLEEQLQKLPVNLPCFFVGDLSVEPVANNSRQMNDFLSFGLLPSINIPTRVTDTSATCIDNMFCKGKPESPLCCC